ncbi:hypothetical protein K030075H31_55620 [Blautia producta]
MKQCSVYWMNCWINNCVFVTIQPFGFIATKVCTQTAKTAVWRVAASGLPCKCKATPRGTVEG